MSCIPFLKLSCFVCFEPPLRATPGRLRSSGAGRQRHRCGARLIITSPSSLPFPLVPPFFSSHTDPVPSTLFAQRYGAAFGRRPPTALSASTLCRPLDRPASRHPPSGFDSAAPRDHWSTVAPLSTDAVSSISAWRCPPGARGPP